MVKRIGEEEIQAVIDVLNRDPVCLSGYYKNPGGGPSTQSLEKSLAEYHGVKHAICVSNGTSALYVSLLACGVGPGEEVITTPLTFSATATAILMCGATPVFVDVDPKTYDLNPERIGENITEKTKAMIPVHLLGMPCNMDPIIEIAERHNLLVVEDNAQCLGGRYKGKITGSIGDISILSFQETKVITTLGEGGAVLTNNDDLAEKSRYLRNHGSQYGGVDYLTYNFRMTEAQAAFGLAQLKKIDLFNEIQVKNAKYLFKHLPKEFHPPYIPLYAEPTLYIIGCIVDDGFPREEFVKKLTERGVNRLLPGATVGLGYTRTIMELPVLQKYWRPCPVAEDLVKHFLWFDCHRWKTEEEMKRTVEDILSCML